jgi:small nuclear ribonucleoprotein D3
VFLRGSRIRFLCVPDMLKNAPMFKRIDPKYKNKAFGVGQANVAVAKARQRAEGGPAGGGGGRGRGRF